MKCNAVLCGIASLCVQVALSGQSANPPVVTAVRAAHVIDVRSGTVISNAVVLVEGERIKAAADLPVPPGARVLDLGDSTLLPGLIDAHTHLLLNLDAGLGVNWQSAAEPESISFLVEIR